MQQRPAEQGECGSVVCPVIRWCAKRAMRCIPEDPDQSIVSGRPWQPGDKGMPLNAHAPERKGGVAKRVDLPQSVCCGTWK